MQSPDQFMSMIEQRLRIVAQQPHYRFRKTSRAVAANYRNRCVEFTGFTEAEIQAIENACGGALPQFYRCFLARMGHAQGELFVGSRLPAANGFGEIREDVLELLRENPTPPALPDDAAIILFHQGYTFDFVRATGGLDSPVFGYVEQETEFRTLAPSFQSYLEAELSAMETNRRELIEGGGYFLTVFEGGGARQERPARISGVRPLDFEDEYTD